MRILSEYAKQKARERANAFYAANKPRVLKRQAACNKIAVNRKTRERTKRWRDAALKVLGGKCLMCGYTDARALQFDHITGGGNIANQQYKSNRSRSCYYRSIALSPNPETVFQVLCANCNLIKRYEQGELNQWESPAVNGASEIISQREPDSASKQQTQVA